VLEMARNGEQRPNQKTTLGRALCCYTNLSRSSYDEEFTKQLMELAPSWIDKVKQKKKELLEMARNGEPRPNQKTTLGRALCCYTNLSSSSYDEEFTKQLMELRPDWFIGQSDIVKQKKQQLLEMARNGEPKPHRKTTLGSALSSYTNPSSPCYDEEFTKQLMELAPSWFIGQSDIAKQNKEQLLEMARNDKPRPTQKTKLGSALCRYSNPSSGCYDPEFTKQIMELRPDWFKRSKKVA